MSGNPIIVLGMHRSGTSALGGMLQRLGVELGANLMPPMEGVNEKGFYEHLDIVTVHEELLAHLDYRWFDVRPFPTQWWRDESIGQFRERLIHIIKRDLVASPFWGVKDPRLCRLLPLWLDIFTELGCEPRFVLIFRSPAEVVESLDHRDGLDMTGAYIAWLWHTLESERWSRGYKRAFIAYDRMLVDWRSTAEKIARELEIEWPVSLGAAERDVASFLDAGLQHCHTMRQTDSRGVNALAHAVYGYLERDAVTLLDRAWEDFQIEIERLTPCLDIVNQTQGLRESSTHIFNALCAEKENARAQIEYRDALLLAQEADSRVRIEHRDAIIAEYREKMSSTKALFIMLCKSIYKTRK